MNQSAPKLVDYDRKTINEKNILEQIQVEKVDTEKVIQKQNTEKINAQPEECAVSNKRLIITKIVLENFKSYYGKTEIGPLQKCFTAIVGPNGSGKSNLIESLLFIFGKRAKWMRLNKLNELLHYSSQHTNVNTASVEVYFQEISGQNYDDDYEFMQSSEFSIKRSINSTNISKYQINGNESSQVEVISLLKSKGIDLNNNRFLILQGEVEEISMMKPKSDNCSDPGLLEYLEDIIGSYQYKDQIENLEIEFDKLIKIKQEKIDRIKISEDDLLKLNELKNLAIDFIKKEKQWFQLINVKYQLDTNKANNLIAKIEEDIISYELRLKQERVNLREKLIEDDGLSIRIHKLKEEMQNNDKAIKHNKKMFEELSNNDAKIQNNKKHELANRNKYKQYLEKLKNQYQHIVETTNQIELLLPNKEKQLEALILLKENEEWKLNDLQFELRDKTQNLRKNRENKEKLMEPFIKSYNIIKNRLNEYSNESRIFNTQQKNQLHDYESLTQKECELNNNLIDLDQKYIEIIKRSQYIRDKIQISHIKLKYLNGKEDELQDQLLDFNFKLEERKRKVNERQIFDQILTELFKAQERKELNGICGRLGDLGTINEEYDIAMAAACPDLDSIVVNRYDDALKCVEFLRTNKIGRTTFIALDRIEWTKDYMTQYSDIPQNSQRLVDLIQFKKEEYRMVFYFVLRDTIVCQDLETATKITHGNIRRRVVTIKGELIDIVGTVSGGIKPEKGGMRYNTKEQFLQEEIKQISKKLDEIKKEMEELKKERLQLEIELPEAQNDQIKVEKEQQNIYLDIEYKKKQLKEIVRKVYKYKEQFLARIQDEKRQIDLNLSIKESIKELENVQKEIDTFQAELNDIDQKIEEIGGKEYKNQINNLKEITINVETLELEVLKMKAQLKNRVKILHNNMREQQEIQERYEVSMNTLSKLNEEEKIIEEEALIILKSQKALIEIKVALDFKFAHLVRENEKIMIERNDLKSRIDKLTLEIDDKKKVLKKAKDEYIRINSMLDDHRNKYRETISQYDFLDSLPEIEKYQIGTIENNTQPLKDISDKKDKDISNKKDKDEILYIMIEVDDNDSEEEKKMLPGSKKIKLNIDINTIYELDIAQDMTIIQLEELQQYYMEIQHKSKYFQDRIKDAQPNINSINEFKYKFIEHGKKLQELNDIKKQANKVKDILQTLKKNRYNEFIKGFNTINAKLKETYQMLTLGGDAELELLDKLDPFSDGIIFSVRPPKKTWKHMAKLSGGEKTLCSLALVFALHYYKPTPLYFMDEIDAALDYKNVAIVGNYIKEKTKNAQFIVISLRNNMFELADRLVGVYKTFDSTKTISIDPIKLLRTIQERKLQKKLKV